MYTNYREAKKAGKKIGVTFGAMDLCHAGHMLMLKDCKSQCDYLVVGLQDDPSLDNNRNKEYRGKLKNRPIMSVDERRIILEGVKYVDEVFVYRTERDLYEWLRDNEYDVRIIGADWKGKKYTGYDLPHTIYYNERTHNYSTTELRERVYRAERERLEEARKEVEDRAKAHEKGASAFSPKLA